MSTEPRRIGVTMRIIEETAYPEPRDALAQDWPAFLARDLPFAQWLPIPNLGADVVTRYARELGVNALILTGGESIGVSPLRDATEAALLAWAADEALPVLGVCRGLQMMAHIAGIGLSPVADHVGTRHRLSGAFTHEVNSFHALAPDAAPAGFDALAWSPDGGLEAMRRRDRLWEAWMWHPEREPGLHADEAQALEALFAPKA